MNEGAAKLARRSGRYQKVLSPDAPLPELAKRQWDEQPHRKRARYSRAWREVARKAFERRGILRPRPEPDDRRQLSRAARNRIKKAIGRLFNEHEKRMALTRRSIELERLKARHGIE